MINLTPDPNEARTLLGVSPDAQENEVIKAYRRKASQWHPDRNVNPRAAEMFDRITRARDVLVEELRSPRVEPKPTPPPTSAPEGTWGSAPTAGESAWVPKAEPQAPPDPWGQGPSTRAARPGGYQHPFPGTSPNPPYRAYSAPLPKRRGSAITALVTAILMVVSCCFVFAVPSVILAMMALNRSYDREKAVRYTRYAWISIGVNLVGGLIIGIAIMSGGE